MSWGLPLHCYLLIAFMCGLAVGLAGVGSALWARHRRSRGRDRDRDRHKDQDQDQVWDEDSGCGRDGRDVVERERRRISGELHDVAGHGLTVIALAARGAAKRAGRSGGDLQAVDLQAIDRLAQQTLDDLRRFVGTLRRGDHIALPAPEPRLADRVAELIDRVPSGTLAVELCVRGDERPVPAPVAGVVLRLTREALTNVIRYGHGRSAVVTITYQRDLAIDVASEMRYCPPRRAPKVPRVGGTGLAGLAERVEELGGLLGHGPARDGRFHVQARIPLLSGGLLERRTTDDRTGEDQWDTFAF